MIQQITGVKYPDGSHRVNDDLEKEFHQAHVSDVQVPVGVQK